LDSKHALPADQSSKSQARRSAGSSRDGEAQDARPLRVAEAAPQRADYNPTRAHTERQISGVALLWLAALGAIVVVVLVWQSLWGLPGLKAWFPIDPPPPPAAAAGDAVQQYLEALAAGKAAPALALAQRVSPDSAWLTDEVLRTSLAQTPISAIGDVRAEGDGSDTHQLISASFLLGDQRVTGWFNVDLIEERWLLEDVTSTIDLSSVNPAEIGLKLNGIPVTTDQVTLFPGVYALSIESKWIELVQDRLVVESPSAGQSFFSTAPVLTDAGSEAVVEAARKQLTSCLKAQELTPKGCGFGILINSSSPVRKQTISWKVVSGEKEITNLQPAIAVGTPLQTVNYVNVSLSFRAVNEEDWVYGGKGAIRVVIADLSQETVQVIFG
jgi:hypothetical protein